MSGRDAAALRELTEEAAGRLAQSDLAEGAVTGVGIDAVDLDRFRHVLARRPRLAERLFTAGELAYAGRTGDPVPRLATRFGAKEATMKALGVGLGAFPLAEVEVVRAGLDPPSLALHGEAAARAGRAGVTRWHLALSHSDRVAMALVVAEGPPRPSSPPSAGGERGPCDRS